jgi:hypothetical protein
MPLDDQELVECCSHPTKTKTFSFLTEKRNVYIYIYMKETDLESDREGAGN